MTIPYEYVIAYLIVGVFLAIGWLIDGFNKTEKIASEDIVLFISIIPMWLSYAFVWLLLTIFQGKKILLRKKKRP